MALTADTSVHKRKKLLVDKKFQLQFLYIWLITAIAMIVLAGGFYYAMTLLMRREIDPIVLKLGVGTAAFILLYTILMGIMTVILTHRVAGAAYRLESHMKKVLSGDFSETVHLRRSDYLRNFAEYLNILTRSLNERREDVQKSITELTALQTMTQQKLNADERRTLQRVIENLSSVRSTEKI